MEPKYVKVVVFAPVSHGEAVREALSEGGAGHIGNYDFCSFSSRGVGRFRGLDGSHQFIGEKGRIEEVEEEKIETICPAEKLETVLEAVKKAHPYEEPGIDIIPLLNE